MASLVATAKLNGVEPLAWLTDVLAGVADRRARAHGLGPDQGARARAAAALGLEGRAARGCRQCLNAVTARRRLLCIGHSSDHAIGIAPETVAKVRRGIEAAAQHRHAGQVG